MVKQTLSLLLAFILAGSQAWALKGGPFDQLLQQAAPYYARLQGTYGITISGTNPDHLSTTGVMVLSVPTSGLAVAKIMIFDQGLMYVGSSSGVFKTGANGVADASGSPVQGMGTAEGSGTLVAQLGHWTVRVTSDGTAGGFGTYLTSMMNGALQVNIGPDTSVADSSALTNVYVTGTGSFWDYPVRLTSVVSTTGSVTSGGSVTSTTTFTNTGSSSDDISTDPGVTDTPTSTDANGKAATLTVSLDGQQQTNGATSIVDFTAPSAGTNGGIGYGESGSTSRQKTFLELLFGL